MLCMLTKSVCVGRLLLLVGFGLSGLVVLDAHRQMGDAHGLNQTASTSLNSSPQSAPKQEENQPENQTTAKTSYHQEIRRQEESLAVNIGVVGAGSDPQVSQVDPAQVAINEWRGASFPVENFQAYTSPFGYRRSPTGGYSQEFHYGLDMAAPQGSYIRNWWAGKVVEVSDDSNCGTSVVIESGNWLHIYCHMQGYVDADSKGRYMIDREGGVQIWEGQDVTAGTRIGRVGMTGRTTGPHLHWGLKFNSNWVDPALVLRAMYASQQNAALPSSNPMR
jgi:murein DD-endopeptidase MepM/ murein hydrolase activator NlpD